MAKRIIIVITLFIVIILAGGCHNVNRHKQLEPLNRNLNEEPIDVEKNISVSDINISDAEIINVPKDIFESTLDLDKFIKEFNFTILETTSKCLIGSIDNLLSDSLYYFIHDRGNNKIFRFNFKGKFLNQVGNAGNGPQEFIEAWSISIDKENDLISIIDLKGRKIVKYKYDGTYIRSNSMYFLFSQHEYNHDHLVLRTGKASNNSVPLISSFELVIANLNQSPVLKAFPIPERTNSFSTDRPLRKFGENVYYHHPFSNLILEIKDKSLGDPIKINFEKNGWPDDIWLYGLDENEMRESLDKYVYFGGNYIITDKFRFLQISSNNNSAMLFKNKESKSVNYGKIIKAEKFLYSFLFSYPSWYRDDGYFIGIKQPYELVQWRDYILENDKNKLTDQEINKLKSLNENDNPIIVTYSLNNF